MLGENFLTQMNGPSRWILLRHIGSPDDPKGIHFDLLLEDRQGCRSWRLEDLPLLDGPSQKASPLPMHRLDWLEHLDGEVSGGRGWASRVMAGFFLGALPRNDLDPVQIQLHSKGMMGNLEIKNFLCTLSSFTGSTRD